MADMLTGEFHRKQIFPKSPIKSERNVFTKVQSRKLLDSDFGTFQTELLMALLTEFDGNKMPIKVFDMSPILVLKMVYN